VEKKIFINIKSRRMKWTGQMASTEDSRDAYGVLVGKSERKRPLGRLTHREEDIRIYLQEVVFGAAWTGSGPGQGCGGGRF